MKFLIESIQKTADIAAGYIVGNLVIDNDQAFLQLENGSLVPAADTVEVKNGDYWQRLSPADFIFKSDQGWPAYAGMVARTKEAVI